jgi:hypothetical protein
MVPLSLRERFAVAYVQVVIGEVSVDDVVVVHQF